MVKLMDNKDVDRGAVLARVGDGDLDAPTAARLLGVSERHLYRLLQTFRKGGVAALDHRQRGRRSNNRIDDALKERVLALIRGRYADLGPTRVAAALAEQDGLKISKETLRAWMIEAGLWLPRTARREARQPHVERGGSEATGTLDPAELASGIQSKVAGGKLSKRAVFLRKSLDIAEHLVTEGGFSGLNARKLADGVGCSIGTLYNVFGNLDGVIQALNARTLDRLYQTLETAASEAADAPVLRMIALANAYIDFAERQPLVWRAVFDHQPADQAAVPDWYQANVEKIADLVVDILSPLFRDAGPPAAHKAATIIWSGVHGICALALGGSLRHVTQAVPRHLAEELIQGYLAGMTARG